MARETWVLVNDKMVLKSVNGELTDNYISLHAKERKKIHGVIGDALPGGVNGMISHADGKRYDSRSSYEKALKAKGCRIVGNDWNNSEWKAPIDRGIKGDFNVRPQLKEAINKVMG